MATEDGVKIWHWLALLPAPLLSGCPASPAPAAARAPVPPIGAAVAARTETATFALG